MAKWEPNAPVKESVQVEKKQNVPVADGDWPTLVFSKSGWCEALHKSYRQGVYRPKSKDEYEALAPFAKK